MLHVRHCLLALAFSLGSGARAFGPPSVVVVEVESALTSDDASSFGLYIRVDSVIDEGAVWRTAVSTSAGWEARLAYNAIYIGDALGYGGSGDIQIEVSASNRTCPSHVVVLELLLEHPDGRFGEVRERIYLVRSRTGVRQVSESDYDQAVREYGTLGDDNEKCQLDAGSSLVLSESEAWLGEGNVSRPGGDGSACDQSDD